MKTPMQELIDKAIAYSRELSVEGYLYESLAVDHIIDLAESMLEKEDDVSKQSELLKDFRKWWNEDNQGVCTTITHKDIERYLESITF